MSHARKKCVRIHTHCQKEEVEMKEEQKEEVEMKEDGRRVGKDGVEEIRGRNMKEIQKE